MGFFSGFVHTFQGIGRTLKHVKIGKFLHRTVFDKKTINVASTLVTRGPIVGAAELGVRAALRAAGQDKIGRLASAGLDTISTAIAAVVLPGVGGIAANTLLKLNAAQREGRMAFNIGGFLGNVGDILSKTGIPGGSTLGAGLSIASNFIPGPRGVPPGRPTVRTPAGSSSFVATPAMASVPALGGAVATVGRGFFRRFPNLATAIQGFRNTGRANITRAKLYSGLKRFGPDMLISGGILTAAAVSELAVAGPGHRRMNVANVKALRKSLRRMEAFHKLCMRVDKLRPRRVSHAKNARR